MNKKLILEDVTFACGEASLVRKAYDESSWEEYAKCSHAFFPGCQLTASDPDSVAAAYQELLFDHPDTAIFMQCCGFAAEKAGDAAMASDIIKKIGIEWETLGKPVLITACSSCRSWFKERLPEIPVTSLYDYFLKYDIPCSEEELTAIKNLGDDTDEILENIFTDIVDETAENNIALNFQNELNSRTMQERHENRLSLKEQLLEFFWNE